MVHQSGVKIDPLEHSALPDSEAKVIRNLMERIDQLETEMTELKDELEENFKNYEIKRSSYGKTQNLRDKEILEYLGE